MSTEPRPTSLYACTPDQIAVKSFFLGPQAENAPWFRELLDKVFDSYFQWRRAVYPGDGAAISDADRLSPTFQESQRRFQDELEGLLRRFEGEMPKFSPRYIGHMFSETSMPALVGHLVTLLHNPNNISGESSRVGVELEDEAIQELARMFGFDPQTTQGHFTSGGTVANFEALIRARRRMERFIFAAAQDRVDHRWTSSLIEAAHMGWERYELLKAQDGEGPTLIRELEEANPFIAAEQLTQIFDQTYRGPVVLVPEHKHYSWVKGVEFMGLGREAFWSVPLDEDGLMSVEGLKTRIDEAIAAARPIMLVVSVAGTTELGAFDPVDKIQDLLDTYARDRGLHIWHHVDAAYGGFFAANICGDDGECILNPAVCQALKAIKRVNSVTLDPHKLGYVPYSSGTFLTRERREYLAHRIDAPYLDFEGQYDRGPQTLEGSRSAAGAVATWLTARTIGLDSDGYGRILGRTIQVRRRFEAVLKGLDLPLRLLPTSSNIIAFCVANPGELLSETNRRSQAIYRAFSPRSAGEFFVSRTSLRLSSYQRMLTRFIDTWGGVADAEELLMIRLCLMNPFLDSRETDLDFLEEFSKALARLF